MSPVCGEGVDREEDEGGRWEQEEAKRSRENRRSRLLGALSATNVNHDKAPSLRTAEGWRAGGLEGWRAGGLKGGEESGENRERGRAEVPGDERSRSTERKAMAGLCEWGSRGRESFAEIGAPRAEGKIFINYTANWRVAGSEFGERQSPRGKAGRFVL
ncbi:hypothetical protein KM043_000815 [Ampulex compressa]|nr:hypothetical protein KM043_000815 [Ampulex compressa]